MVGGLRLGARRARSFSHRLAGDRNVVLDRDRHARKRQRGQIGTMGEGESVGAGLLGEDAGEGANLRVSFRDDGQGRLHGLDRTRHAGAHTVGDADGRGERVIAHHSSIGFSDSIISTIRAGYGRSAGLPFACPRTGLATPAQ